MPAAPAPGPLTSVGEYVVGRRIGSGGMAVVDAAYQNGAAGGRLVALKRIAAAFSNDPSARRMFLREASIVTRLEHPNVVRTYEVGEADGEAFIAMELLEGATVSQLQRATAERVPLPIALRIVRDALRGLHAAHELCALGGKVLGLIHQDVSPQNIHVAYEGTTRILDFGVARLTTVDASRTDSVRGKPCYLAPEQLNLGSIDRRADIFAMGIVLHELLTGAYLFPRTSLDAAYAAILSGTIRPPRATHPDLPEELDAVVSRALARVPADRFATADEMRRALAAAQEGSGVAEIDVASLGAWVQGIAPPAWTRGEIELEVTEGRAKTTTLDLGAHEVTLPKRGARTGGPNADDAGAATNGALPMVSQPRRGIASRAALPALAALSVLAVVLARGGAGSKREPAPPAGAIAGGESATTESARVAPVETSVTSVAPSASGPESLPPSSLPLHSASPMPPRHPRLAPPSNRVPAVPLAVSPVETPPSTPPEAPPKKADVYDQM
jgi:eukaryotic-like serine/threonine-protein kinase